MSTDEVTRLEPGGSRSSWFVAARRRPVVAGLLVSAVVHAALLAMVDLRRPSPSAAASPRGEVRLVDLPPRVDVPPPPGDIEPPRAPEVEGITPTEPAVGARPKISSPGPAPGIEPPEVSGSHRFTSTIAKVEVAPTIEAPERFRRRLERHSAEALRDVEVGGVVELRLYVDPRGQVSRVRVAESSGHGALDRVARQTAEEVDFLPALKRDRTVGVWVTQRICFVHVDRPRPAMSPAECERRVAARRR